MIDYLTWKIKNKLITESQSDRDEKIRLAIEELVAEYSKLIAQIIDNEVKTKLSSVPVATAAVPEMVKHVLNKNIKTYLENKKLLPLKLLSERELKDIMMKCGISRYQILESTAQNSVQSLLGDAAERIYKLLTGDKQKDAQEIEKFVNDNLDKIKEDVRKAIEMDKNVSIKTYISKKGIPDPDSDEAKFHVEVLRKLASKEGVTFLKNWSAKSQKNLKTIFPKIANSAVPFVKSPDEQKKDFYSDVNRDIGKETAGSNTYADFVKYIKNKANAVSIALSDKDIEDNIINQSDFNKLKNPSKSNLSINPPTPTTSAANPVVVPPTTNPTVIPSTPTANPVSPTAPTATPAVNTSSAKKPPVQKPKLRDSRVKLPVPGVGQMIRSPGFFGKEVEFKDWRPLTDHEKWYLSSDKAGMIYHNIGADDIDENIKKVTKMILSGANPLEIAQQGITAQNTVRFALNKLGYPDKAYDIAHGKYKPD